MEKKDVAMAYGFEEKKELAYTDEIEAVNPAPKKKVRRPPQRKTHSTILTDDDQ